MSRAVSPTLLTQAPIITEDEGAVCCGCRPRRKRRWRRIKKSMGRRILLRHAPQFFDAEEGNQSEGCGSEKDSLYYFDAEQDPLADDEFPAPATREIELIKYVRKVEATESAKEGFPSAPPQLPPRPEAYGTSVDFAGNITRKKVSFRGHDISSPIANHRVPSARFDSLCARSIEELKEDLLEPRVKIPFNGYPGGLTEAELQECEKFLQGLKERNPAIWEQVYSFRDIEEPSYTICRWLRATKFDASKILERLSDNQADFEEARDAEFYPDVSKAIGAPFSVFLSQYPFIPIGRGKNGCPANYFLAGRINPEGILSMTTKSNMSGYFWWTFMHKFKQEIRKAQSRDPDFVRVEGINILDLQGLSASALSGDTVDVVKLASKVSDFFPETLSCMVIINAPGFFSMFWGLIKKFIDPRTASRIQVYSNTEKGLAALRELIEVSDIPTDYGGTNKSVKEAFVEEAHDPRLRKQEVKLLHIKRKGGKAALKEEWLVGPGEYIEIRAYTRSASSANVTVTMDDDPRTTVECKCAFEEAADSSSTPLPHCTVVVSNLKGPGKVSVEAHDLDNCHKKHQGQSRGYFLIVGDIKVVDGATIGVNGH